MLKENIFKMFLGILTILENKKSAIQIDVAKTLIIGWIKILYKNLYILMCWYF